MQFRNFLPLVFLLMFSIAAFVVHCGVFYLMGIDDANRFYHPLWEVYGFFFLCSAAILLILSVVRQKSIDNVGQTFILSTCIKAGIAYAFFLYPAINASAQNLQFEKMNFFVVFALFLAVETVLTIRILNKP